MPSQSRLHIGWELNTLSNIRYDIVYVCVVLFHKSVIIVRAMNRFKALDSKAADTAVETTLSSYHQNTVT